jgi:uncharacterized damage-inducible protein DinB
MNLLANLQDQFLHMEWSDAIVWKAVLASEAALADETIHTRLHHTHMVQRTFLAVWRDEFGGFADRNELQRTLMEWAKQGSDLQGTALMAWGQAYHREAQQYLASVSEVALGDAVVLPWADMVAARIGQPPATSTKAETMVQVTMHSAYHRGQVNVRLREVGTEPPLVDFIAWVWLGKPAASWPSA